MAEGSFPGSPDEEMGRVVLLPDRRIWSILRDEDEDSSSSVNGDGLDELEYEYEPGIGLQNLTFAEEIGDNSVGSSRRDSVVVSRCAQCGINYESDLQLAAELGKTLLERNKELEASLKRQQSIIEDQSQEIEYLTKQTGTLREVNDSRVKIYEQLEVSISELEATNKKMAEDNLADKAKIKSLCDNVERLEMHCEELQRLLDEARLSLNNQQQLNSSRSRRLKRSIVDDGQVNNEGHDECDEELDISSSEADSDHVELLSNRVQESGYSSGSADIRLTADSDSDLSSPEKESAPSTMIVRATASLNEEIRAEKLLIDKQQLADRLADVEQVVGHLEGENKRLQHLLAKESSCSTVMTPSVDCEVQNVQDVRSGRLCRKCLNLIDATPANLIGTALHMMGDTAKDELEKAILGLDSGWRSRIEWLDAWCLAVGALAMAAYVIHSANTLELKASEEPLSLHDELMMSEKSPETAKSRQIFSEIFALLRSSQFDEQVT